MSKITRDCQKGGPPITASKCMIIMKICTSVTSILIRYKKPKKKKQNYSKQFQVSYSQAQRHNSVMHSIKAEEKQKNSNNLADKNVFSFIVQIKSNVVL